MMMRTLSHHGLVLFKAHLGEPFLEMLIFFFVFKKNHLLVSAKPARKSPKPALKRANLALKRPNRHLTNIKEIKTGTEAPKPALNKGSR